MYTYMYIYYILSMVLFYFFISVRYSLNNVVILSRWHDSHHNSSRRSHNVLCHTHCISAAADPACTGFQFRDYGIIDPTIQIYIYKSIIPIRAYDRI